MAMTKKPQLNPALKLALDLGPLVVFFLANSHPEWFAPVVSHFLPKNLVQGEHAGIFTATAIFMPAVLAALVISYALTRRLPIMSVVTAIIVLVFGGLALRLQNQDFFKIKLTIIYGVFGLVLLGGLFFNKPVLSVVFDSLFHLTEEGWRKLTWRWAIFFVALAVLNEIVRPYFSDAMWVNFKVFGVTSLTFLFAILQYPLLKKYAAEPAAE
jgi:intracellular septation protein